jgi:SHAQKYF class myb-like DNA-binding protein
MLAPSLLPTLATSGEAAHLFPRMQQACSSKMRSSPGPSCSNNDSHDVTGIAPSVLAAHDAASKSHANAGEIARSGTRPGSDDCQCSADSLNHSTRNSIPCRGAPNTVARNPNNQRLPFFPEAPLPIFAKAPEPTKAANEPANTAKTFPANSSSDLKRPRAMDYKKSRMVWSEELHTQFLRALSDIGLRHAVPKTIMQVYSLPCVRIGCL